MSKIKKLSLALVIIGAGFVLLNLCAKPVHAADGGVVEYQGVLEKHPNPSYTHRLAGQKVNFILSSMYNVYEGQEVKVRVQFTVDNKFSVLSIDSVQEVTPTTPTPTVSGNRVTFQGKLVKNPNPAYTHMLEGQSVNFILGSQYAQFEGKMVQVEVETYSANKFVVISIVEIK